MVHSPIPPVGTETAPSRMDEDPFQRSTRTMRSPIQQPLFDPSTLGPEGVKEEPIEETEDEGDI